MLARTSTISMHQYFVVFHAVNEQQIGKKAHADQKMGARKRYELKLSQELGEDAESASSRAKNFAGWSSRALQIFDF